MKGGPVVTLHQNAKTCPASRRLMCRRVELEGWSLRAAAEALDVLDEPRVTEALLRGAFAVSGSVRSSRVADATTASTARRLELHACT